MSALSDDSFHMHNARLLASLVSGRPDGVVRATVVVPSNERLLVMDPRNAELKKWIRRAIPKGRAYVHGHDVYANMADATTYEFKPGTQVMTLTMTETKEGSRRFACHLVHPPPTAEEAERCSAAAERVASGTPDDEDDDDTSVSDTDV